MSARGCIAAWLTCAREKLTDKLRCRSDMQVGRLASCQSAGVLPVRPLTAQSARTSLLSKPVHLSARQPVRRTKRPHVLKMQAGSVEKSVDTEVDTDNKFRFTNSVSENSFEVRGDIEKVFQYAADFSHIDKWDSGTLGLKPGPRWVMESAAFYSMLTWPLSCRHH